jgi:hypothetical protein
LPKSKAYAEGRKKFGEWQDRHADEHLGRAKRLEEDLEEVKQQLKSKTSSADESKRVEKPRTEQPKAEKPGVQQPAVHQSTPKQSGVQPSGEQQHTVQQ